jgi:hypothetical protein
MLHQECLALCGLDCSTCGNYQTNLNCQGCRLETVLVADCPTRTCCLAKGLPHCGVCDHFPCYELSMFYWDGNPLHRQAMENMLLIRQQITSTDK